MPPLSTDSSVAEAISKSTGSHFDLSDSTPLSGGSISRSSRIKARDGRAFFLKQNDPAFLTFFKAEAQALEEISGTSSVSVPRLICHGLTESSSFLVLSLFEEGIPTPASQEKLGIQLAQLHKVKQPHFGWSTDNCIGSTPQPNPRSEDWVSFYREQRLGHQLDLAQSKGKSFTGSCDLLKNLAAFFPGYLPQPALLHGDLWGGNVSVDQNGQPIVYDPASYYGDREADLAFTYMFGGFTSHFYQAYENAYPLDPGFKIRKILYNLYHELNHFNLFGGGYASSSQSSINQLLDHLP